MALAAAGAVMMLAWAALRQIGGQTGDILGATQVICELILIAGIAAAVP